MFGRFFMAGMLALACGLSSEALAGPGSRAERRLRQEVALNLGEEPPSLDPTKQVDSVSFTILTHVYEGLLTTDASGRVVPGVAEAHSVSPDRRTWTFRLRENARWHDGRPVVAQDFVFAFRRIPDPAFASAYAFIAETARLENAGEIISGKKPPSALGVRALDDHTLELRLTGPVPFLTQLMTFQAFYPVRPDLVAAQKEKFNTEAHQIIGNGPYRIVSWKHDASLRLERADTYWNRKAITLSVIDFPILVKDSTSKYNLFSTENLDMVTLDGGNLKTALAARQRIESSPTGCTSLLLPNLRKGRIFESPELRKALSVGLKRREIADRIVAVPGTRPAVGVVPAIIPGGRGKFRKEHALRVRDGNLEEARRLVAAHRAKGRLAAVPAFEVLCTDDDAGKELCAYLQNEMQQIFGTQVRVVNLPWKSHLQRSRDGDFDLSLAGWCPDYEDAMTFLDLFQEANGYNTGRYLNPHYEKLVVKARETRDPIVRSRLLGEAERLLIEKDVGAIGLFEGSRAHVAAPGLTGVRFNPFGANPDLRYARWK